MVERNTRVRASQVAPLLPDDLDASNSPVDGYFPKYDSGAGKFTWVSAAGSGDMLKSTYDTDNDGIVDKAETVDDGAGNSKTAAQIKSHIDSTSNPHSVTKTQVSLGNVDNVQQLPISYLDTDGTLAANSDTKVPSQKAVKTYADAIASDVVRNELNIVLNAFRIAIQGSLTLQNMVDGIVDEYEDETGVDTSGSTNESYDSVNDLYSPTPGLPSSEYTSDSYTKLLFHGNKVDGSISHAVTTNGNAQIDTAQSKFGGASGLFDGTGDYLSIPDSNDWNFGSGDFTIDCWVRFNSLVSNSPFIFQGSDGNNRYQFRWTTTNYLEFTQINSSVTDISISASWTPSTNTWYHIAVVRNGSSWYLFVDGIQIGTNTDPTSITDYSEVLYIGGTVTGVYFDGWLDELRISKGIARWTANFTLETSAYISDQYNVLLLHMDGTDTSTTFADASGGDESGNEKVVTYNGNAQIDTAQSKFGGASGLFDGTGDYLTIPNSSDFLFGSGDFTIDCWIRLNSLPSTSQLDLVSIWGADLSYLLRLTTDNKITLFASSSGSSTTNTYTSDAVSWSTGTWYHLAVVRDTNTLRFFIDGASVGTTAISITFYASTTIFYIGANDNSQASSFNGHLDELRVSKGIARWTSNFATPLNMTLLSIANTAQAAPSTSRIVLFEENVDSITINTDLKAYASRDNGTTYTQITLADEGNYSSGKRILTGQAIISAQPSGTNMKYKIETLNNKNLKLHGTALSWD